MACRARRVMMGRTFDLDLYTDRILPFTTNDTSPEEADMTTTEKTKYQTWQIGDVRVTKVAEMKDIPADATFLFTEDAIDLIKNTKWLHPHFATEDGGIRISIHAFVIESQGKRIVVDTCVGNDKDRNGSMFHNLSLPFLADMEEAGFPVGSIDYVLCTHMHVDHVGWNTRLVDGKWVPTFPNARYLFAKTEFDHWMDPSAQDIGFGDVMGDSVKPIIEAGLHQLVESDHRVNDEVWLEPTPGHTPGHVSVRISSKGQDAVVTGDMMHHPVQIATPQMSSNFCSDPQQARETRAAFVGRYADKPVLVMGTHFATPTAGHIVKDGAAHRLKVD